MKTRKIELDVDVIGGQGPLTEKEEKELSEFFSQSKSTKNKTVTKSPKTTKRSNVITPNPSERALYLANLFKKGVETFGSPNKFHNWLNIENAAMGNEKPASYLKTFSGIQLVLDQLNAIEYGFSA